MSAEPGVSADTLQIARSCVSGKSMRTHPEQRAPVWLTANADAPNVKSPARWRGSWDGDDGVSCHLIELFKIGIISVELDVIGPCGHRLAVHDEAENRHHVTLQPSSNVFASGPSFY